MKICWDNLEKLRYCPEIGCWRTIKDGHKHIYKENCVVCGEPYITPAYKGGSDYCSPSCVSNSPDVRQKRREKLKNKWKDPKFKEKTKKAIREALKRPEYIEGVSERSKKMWKDPERRKKHSEAMKKKWQDPQHRQIVIKSQKIKFQEPAHKKRRSEIAKQKWDDPEYRKKMVDKLKKRYEEDEYREKLSESIRSTWQDAELRKKHSETLKKISQDSEYRKGLRERSKKMWENPEYRKKVRDRIKKAYADPEARKRQSERSKKLWENPDHRKKMRKSMAKALERDPGLAKRRTEHAYKGGVYERGVPLYDTYAHQIDYAEEVRRNPEETILLQVKCAYCGRWYTPKTKSLLGRIAALEGRVRGEVRLYCSSNCKKACPIYYQQLWPKDHKPATSREVQPELRQMRLEIDSYTCQNENCRKTIDEAELHCHHNTSVRLNPIESADVDNCITLCKKCHKMVHKECDGYFRCD